MPSEFGIVLKHLRQELRISQADLAGTISSTQRHVSFMETGRSLPTRIMIGRLATELNLNAGQRASLFDASGFRNPYKRRTFTSTEVTEVLDMIEVRMLSHWPFPAWVMDAEWTVFRMNKPATAMFAPFMDPKTEQLNIFSLFLSKNFQAMIENWEEASLSLYFRLQSASTHSAMLRQSFEDARQQGMFDHIIKEMTQANDIPIYIPTVLKLPDGSRLRLTSMLGQLVSIHDALVEGFEIELMIPIDAESEVSLKKIS